MKVYFHSKQIEFAYIPKISKNHFLNMLLITLCISLRKYKSFMSGYTIGIINFTVIFEGMEIIEKWKPNSAGTP